TIWEYDIDGFGIFPSGQHYLSIEGQDLAGNQIQSDPQVISIRQQMDNNRSVWDPPACPGADVYHSFEISPCMLAFDFSPDQLVAGEETIVYITNLSSGYDGSNYQWYWTFVANTDPISYEGINPPPITFLDDNDPGSYKIQLQLFNGGDFIDYKKEYIEIIDPATYLDVDFVAEAISDDGELYGNSPLTVDFTDITTGNPDSWIWDFGDGWGTSYDQNPSYTFSNNSGSPQQYTVSLEACNTVTNCAVEMKDALITVYPQNAPLNPVAIFSLSQTSLFAPCTVSFTNNSSGEIDEFAWDLDGDGYYDYFSKNPEPLLYNGATNIEISLKVTNNTTQASDVLSKQFYVYENPNSGYTVDFSWDPDPPIAGSLIHFDEDVTGFYYAYNCKWIIYGPFGYYNESYLHNPYLTLNEPGTYSVILEVYDFYDNFLGVCSKPVNVTPSSLVGAPGEIIPDDISYWAKFGESVAIDGNFAVVGAPGHEHNGHLSGAIYIYKYYPESEQWNLKQGPLFPNDPQGTDMFGTSVDISGNFIAVGAPYQSNSVERNGAVYIFEYDGSAWYQQPEKLIPHDATFNDGCGGSLAIDGNYLIIGTSGGVVFPGTDSLNYAGNRDHQGKAYIYKLVNNTWVEICKIYDENGFVDDGFGKTVSISGNKVAVGSIEKAFVYHHIFDDTWEQYTIPYNSSNNSFPVEVSVSQNSLLIGDSRDHYYGQGTNSGTAHIYEFINEQWVKTCELSHNAMDHSLFGYSVSINGNYAVIGAPGEDIFATRSGSAYIFRKNAFGFWCLVNKVTPEYDPYVGYQSTVYGYSVFCGSSSLIIGRPAGRLAGYNWVPLPPESFPGAVTIFTNYVYPCDRIISETDYHPMQGTYPENAAGYITLGGNPPGEVYFQTGVDIAYVGGDISLLDGFTAANGCNFTAKGMACSIQPSKPQSIYTTNSNFKTEAGLEDEIALSSEINNEGQGIKIYPNPTTGSVNVDFPDQVSDKIEFLFANVFGKQSVIDVEIKGKSISMDLSPYPKGIYLLTIKTNNNVFTDKIVLQ
nr:T9SS type A sorting domain-containing protein [Bacteroidota bacterium]